MAHTIDLTKIEGAQLSSEGNASDLAYLKANGPRALPDSPTANGWSADAIKKQFYKQSEILFAWLKRLAESQLDLGEKINDYLADLGSGGEFPLVFDTLANAQAAVSAGEVKAGSIVFVSNGSDIKAYYCGDEGLVSIGGGLVHKSGAETISGKKTFSGGASFTSGNVNFGSSGSDNSKQLDIYYAINLRGPVTSNNIIPGNTFSLGSAEHYWGFAYIDDLFLYGVISDGMYEWSFPSKNGTIVLDSDITKSALETTLGAASSSSNGYMSSSDKSHLDTLYALLGSESDADSVVDTINEVLSVFNQYPEGVELATVLGGKVGYSDIVDVLNSTATNKALSANQGKALNDRLTTAEGTISNHGTRLTTAEADKADKTGYYGTMGAGFADTAKSLQTSVGNDDETPFAFQTTGGSADVETGIQQLKKLVGATVVRNQLVPPLTTHTINGITCTPVGDGSYTLSGIATADVYILFGNVGKRTGHTIYAGLAKEEITGVRLQDANYGVIFTKTQKILTINYSTNVAVHIYVANGTDLTTPVTVRPVFIDLTQTYGNNTVVNAILGNDSSKYVERLLKFDPNLLKQVAFNAGTLVDSQSAFEKSVGRNMYDASKQAYQDGSYYTFVLDYMRVKPSQEIMVEITDSSLITPAAIYYEEYDINKNPIFLGADGNGGALYNNKKMVRTPSANAAYVRFRLYHSTAQTATYFRTLAQAILVQYTWDGSQTDYVPYEEHIYDLPNIVQRGVLKVDGSGNIYADGDVAYPDGTGSVKTNIKTFTGSESWTWYADQSFWYCVDDNMGATLGQTLTSNGIIAKIAGASANVIRVLASDNPQISSSSDMNAIFPNGTKMLYSLATPTAITFDPYPENVWGDDFGTTQFLDSDGNEIVGLQGAEFFYRANIAGFAESICIREDIDGDPAQLVSHTELSASHYTKAQADARFALKEALGGTLRQVLAVKETLDFDNTAYVDLGELTWTYSSTATYPRFLATVSDLKPELDDTKMRKLITTKYATSSWYAIYSSGDDKVVASISNSVVIRDTSYTDADSFKAAMKGVLLAYEKAS